MAHKRKGRTAKINRQWSVLETLDARIAYFEARYPAKHLQEDSHYNRLKWEAANLRRNLRTKGVAV